jgi:SAM-dependent methyltransferase
MTAPADLTLLPSTDPLEIYRYRDGLYAVDLVTAAVCEFDFFTWLSTHPANTAGICRNLELAVRPVDVMLTLFAAEKWVRREGEVWTVTPLAREHLVSTSPFFLGPYYASLKERPVVRDYVTILRTGRPANWGSYRHEKAWSVAMESEEFATTFTAAMDCRGAYLGPALARQIDGRGRRRLLDIAGGSGIYACTVVAHHPHLRAAVLERAPVDAIARTMMRKRGYADRVDVLAGDMFAAPLPAGFDLHLLSNVLHDWDVPQVRQLLAASFQALEPGGVLVVHDAHLDADKCGPLPVAKYSALLMAVTEGRCYAVSEMESLLGEAGYTDVSHAATVADRSVMMARKPGR